MILVDTSALSLAFRRKRHQLNPYELLVCRLLESAIAESQVELLGMVRAEALMGIREKAQYERVRRALRGFDDVALTIADYEGAAEMSNRCRAAGITGGPVDFLICAVAVRRRWQILATDRDFYRYKRHLPLELLAPSAPRPN